MPLEVSSTAHRVRHITPHGARHDRNFVLYWMTAQRRLRFNFALDHALELSREVGTPLLIFEPLRVDYRWASERFHAFVTDGMCDNQRACLEAGITYYPYVEPRPRAGSGMLLELARRAACVVTDDYPGFFIPALLRAAGRRLGREGIALHAVDSNGLYPMHHADRVFPTAYAFRRHLQRSLPPLLGQFPRSQPFRNYRGGAARIPPQLQRRWPDASAALMAGRPLRGLPLRGDVARVALRGGSVEGRKRLKYFVSQVLPGYAQERNHPDHEGVSGLSPYLHFGHIGAHQVFYELSRELGWTPEQLGATRNGARVGFWGMSESAESYLDQLVTWRELGFNMCAHHSSYDRYESLPSWAKQTLGEHAADPRPHLYDLDRFEAADTHDELWNAAQRQLVSEGVMHNYLRMLWGKKILEWSASPQAALQIMIELNNKYALDGRDPNSYSGIFWVLGRYDRAWGPKRPIFGSVRYMSSENTRRKLRLTNYLERYGARQLSLL